MSYIGNSPENVLQARTAEYEYTATAGQTAFSGVDNNGLSLDLLLANQNEVYLNGSRLVSDDDFTVSGDALTLTVAAAAGDILVIKTQTEVSNIASYTKAEADSRYVNYSGDIVAGDLQISGTVSATDLVVDTDTLYVDSTNNRVGVGTPSPSATLDVNSTVNGVQAHFGTPSNRELIIRSASSGGYDDALTKFHKNSSAGEFAFSNTGGERMRIDSSGNVGIGTSSPTTALTVSTDGTEQLTLNRADASINVGNAVGTILFTGDDPSASQTGAKIQVLASQNWSANAYGSHITFSNDSSGTLTERVRIDNSGNLILKATSDTGNRLQINGADETSELLEIGITSGHAQLTATHASGGSNSAGFIFRTRNGTAGTNEKMRLDASGNLLVGKTSASSTTAGFQASQDGQTAINRSGTALQVGRLSSDGSIIDLRKDGSSVGSIGVVNANNMYLSGSASNHAGVQFGTQNVTPYNNGSQSDGAVDLGAFNLRWRDAYLSGGVYLGGTGSANKLDDYEEGDFQPYFSTTGITGSISYSSQHGTYTKIGRRVFFWFDFTVSSWSGATGSPLISLPYASSGTSEMGAFTPWDIHNNYTGSRTPTQWISQNSSWMRMYTWTGDTAMGHNPWAVNQIGRVSGSVSYTSS